MDTSALNESARKVFGTDAVVAPHHESAQTMAHDGTASGVSVQPSLVQELLRALIQAEAALNKIRVCCLHTAWDQTGPAVIAAREAISLARTSSEVAA